MRIDIRAINLDAHPLLHAFVQRRIWFSLGRFGDRIHRVIVRLEDLNGPRGGLDQRCQIEVRLARRGTLVVDVTDVEMEPAVGRAAERMARRVREQLAMRRQAKRRAVPTGVATAA